MPDERKMSIAQAGLEYLMTYGWAMILIVTVATILFFIISTPKGYACSTFVGKLICQAANATGDELYLTIQNTTPGSDITINPFTGISFGGKTGYAIIIYGGKEYRFEDVIIKSGDKFQIKAKGMILENQAEITYTENQTGYTKTANISITGSPLVPVEISNNGTADTSSGLIDCMNADVSECYYVLKATNGAIGDVPLTTAQPSQTFTFTITDPINFGGKIDNPYISQMQQISVGFAFYIVGTPPTNVNYTYSGTSGTKTGLKTGWNTIEITTTDPLNDSLNFVLSRNTQDFSIAGKDTANPPKLAITIKNNGGGGGG